MTPTLCYLLSANRSIQDIASKKFTLIDVFTTITIPKDQAFTLQSFVVAGRLTDVSLGVFKADVKIVDASGNVLQVSILEGNITLRDLSFVAGFNFVRMDKPGKYFLKMSVNGKELRDENRFFVEIIKA